MCHDKKVKLAFGLYPLIDRPTRVTSHSATIIDNVFTNQVKNLTSGLIVDDISDHFAIFTLYKFDGIHRSTTELICKRTLLSKNIENVCKTLGDYSWDNVLSSNDVNIAYDLLLTKLKKCLDLHCPVKKIKREKNKNDKPWITKTLKNSIKKKQLLYITFLKQRTKKCKRNLG